MTNNSLIKIIRDVRNFPKKGIIFKDITTLLKDKNTFREAIGLLYEHYKDKKIDIVVSVEARGFIFGSALAYKLGCGFVPVRKKGKLPYKTISEKYELEYGTDELFMHQDAIEKGQNILIIDDLLATGGTIKAVISLIEKLGGKISGIGFLIELLFLNGKDKLKNYDIFSVIKY